ncbi:MAG: hypothetical protein AAFQ05_10480, partial [Pseudomonadota bacterium]
MTLTPSELLAGTPPVTRPIIALSEGEDGRVIAGGMAAQKAGLADVIFVGRSDHVDVPGATVHGLQRCHGNHLCHILRAAPARKIIG